ncbi:MAG: exodeoxyribonuclease VII large subunit, partial [Chitinivibrionia bacterium]|nr:exodeoxyribonuclease VII large subunit [Chitinivibrionia bacterium]
MSSAERDILTVTEINELARALIEESFPEVSVLGEISNFKRHSSGHLYLTLKDAGAQLRTVCFKGDALSLDFDPEDGMLAVARGRLTLYEPYGQFQLVARTMEKAGAGELERAFRALCARLEKEGLFAPEHKKPLPAYPRRIAVITSPTGAAVRDIVSTLKRRWPCVEIVLLPVRVQGSEAAPEITAALELAPRLAPVDIVILGRGGGSLEDLWAFNEETVARAIFDCPIPVISAVGHETDFTIADFV